MRVALCDMADFTAIFVLRVERTYHFIPTLRNIFAIGRKIEREEERERERQFQCHAKDAASSIWMVRDCLLRKTRKDRCVDGLLLPASP